MKHKKEIFIISFIILAFFSYCSYLVLTRKPQSHFGISKNYVEKIAAKYHTEKYQLLNYADIKTTYTITSIPNGFRINKKKLKAIPETESFPIEETSVVLDNNTSKISETQSLEIKNIVSLLPKKDPKININQQTRASEWNLYDKNGILLPKEKAKEILGNHYYNLANVNYYYNFPQYKFYMTLSGYEKPKLCSTELYIGSEFSLSNGSSYSSYINQDEKSDIHVGFNYNLWYSTPVNIVMNIAYGKSVIREMPCKEGEIIGFNNFRCILLKIVKGQQTSTNYNRNAIEVTLSPGNDKNMEKYIFAFTDISVYKSIDIDFLCDDGKIRNSYSSGISSDGLGDLELKNDEGFKVEKIRFHLKQKIVRITKHLDKLPGMSEENNKAEDLLDVKVSYVKLSSYFDMKSVLEKSLMMEIFTQTKRMPFMAVGAFPREYENVTLREILKDFEALHPRTTTILDYDHRQIIIKDRDNFFTRIRKIFR